MQQQMGMGQRSAPQDRLGLGLGGSRDDPDAGNSLPQVSDGILVEMGLSPQS